MAKIIFMSSSGSENPTKAAFPFILANGAVEAGYEAEVSIFADAVVIMKDVVTNSVVPVGWPPLKELMATTIKNKVPIYV
jgi:predicted peroxiredoxin